MQAGRVMMGGNQSAAGRYSKAAACSVGLDYDDLLTVAKTGGRAAFERLVESAVPRVFQSLCRITKNREDAEDALQDALMSAFVNLHNFDGRSSFSTWLTRIAINAALMILRKKRVHREVSIEGPTTPDGEQSYWEIADHAPNPERVYMLEEQGRALRGAVHSLRPAIREVVELQQLQEHSMKETAAMMGISVGAAKARLFHARAALRKSRRLKSMRRGRTLANVRLAHGALRGRRAVGMR